MSKCNHFWRAIDSRRSQCSKCKEITKSPCREPECVMKQEEIAGLKRCADQAEEDRDYWKSAHGKLAEETSQRELKFDYWRDKAKEQAEEIAALRAEKLTDASALRLALERIAELEKVVEAAPELERVKYAWALYCGRGSKWDDAWREAGYLKENGDVLA